MLMPVVLAKRNVHSWHMYQQFLSYCLPVVRGIFKPSYSFNAQLIAEYKFRLWKGHRAEFLGRYSRANQNTVCTSRCAHLQDTLHCNPTRSRHNQMSKNQNSECCSRACKHNQPAKKFTAQKHGLHQ